jgi:hypothetical protein
LVEKGKELETENVSLRKQLEILKKEKMDITAENWEEKVKNLTALLEVEQQARKELQVETQVPV